MSPSTGSSAHTSGAGLLLLAGRQHCAEEEASRPEVASVGEPSEPQKIRSPVLRAQVLLIEHVEQSFRTSGAEGTEMR